MTDQIREVEHYSAPIPYKVGEGARLLVALRNTVGAVTDIVKALFEVHVKVGALRRSRKLRCVIFLAERTTTSFSMPEWEFRQRGFAGPHKFGLFRPDDVLRYENPRKTFALSVRFGRVYMFEPSSVPAPRMLRSTAATNTFRRGVCFGVALPKSRARALQFG